VRSTLTPSILNSEHSTINANNSKRFIQYEQFNPNSYSKYEIENETTLLLPKLTILHRNPEANT
jgi:hypothetical protein